MPVSQHWKVQLSDVVVSWKLHLIHTQVLYLYLEEPSVDPVAEVEDGLELELSWPLVSIRYVPQTLVFSSVKYRIYTLSVGLSHLYFCIMCL